MYCHNCGTTSAHNCGSLTVFLLILSFSLLCLPLCTGIWVGHTTLHFLCRHNKTLTLIMVGNMHNRFPLEDRKVETIERHESLHYIQEAYWMSHFQYSKTCNIDTNHATT
jgi:hypothetical protein